MQEKKDGQNYAPKGKSQPVVAKGEFKVGVTGLDHGHIYGMCNGLKEAGADIAYVYDEDIERAEKFTESFPEAEILGSLDALLDSDCKMIASASIPCNRWDVGIQAMKHGKDYFTDKPPVTTLDQIEAIEKTIKETGRKYMAYFSERLHVEGSVYAEQLLKEGRIGKVLQVMGWGPHRLSESTRPSWFFEKEKYGGIIVDIGCHQIEQIVHFAGAETASINESRIANYWHKNHEGFEDFADCTLTCDNGVAGYFRVDWFTPDGLGAWGDGRTLILGTDGYIEIRKYIDIANNKEGDQVYLVDKEGEHHYNASETVGFPYFGKLILDCINRTEEAMTQNHVLNIMRLAIEAEEKAVRLDFV